MKARTTLIKNYRNKETLRLVELQEVADFIRNGAFQEQVSEFRSVFPLMTFADRNDEGTLTGYVNWPKNLPRICFALEQEHRNGERITRGYTGLVLLEVNNLASHDEADAVRKGAAEMPQTLMAFVGADGQSVKIVCQGELFPGGSRLPESDVEIALFHENLYERARLIYNGQLGVTVEKLEPTTQRICYMSSDPGLVYNPMATPIYAKAEKATESITHQRSALEQTESYERYKSMHTVYEFSLSKAYDDTEGIADKDERHHAILSRLAQYCMETGLAMAPAMRQTLMKSMFWDEEDLVKKVFENAYREELVERYMEKKGIELRA